MARLAGVPRAVVHVHNADEHVPVGKIYKRRILREPLRRICLLMADRIVGNSNHTLDMFLAGRPRRPGRDIVLYYGLDPTRFENAIPDRAGLRHQLGLPADVLVLLFAGRMVPEKNPLFVIDVLMNLRSLEPRAVAVFAGAGSQEQIVLSRAREYGIENAVRVLGWRDDIPEIMCCCDWFILPHPEQRMEGFGLAVVEAQLAGLRMLLSKGIPDDPLLPTASFRRLTLAAGPKAWAEAAADLFRTPAPSRTAAFAALRESPMDMNRALDGLVRLYA
jgi:glycosyltransferase involved in cell wall biosynthesis